jgi:hypothetical protein
VTNSNLGFGISIFFFSMIVGSLILILFFVGKNVFESGDKDFSLSTTFFFIGFVLMFIIGSIQSKLQFSIFSVGKSNLLSLLSSQLSSSEDFILNVFNVPVAEELLWLIAIPFLIIVLLNTIGVKNKWVQFGIIIAVSSVSFALFHVGKIFLTFLISAFVFRTVLLFLYVGDGLLNTITWADIGASLALGIHVGNNWATYGFWNGISLLLDSVWGIILLVIFGVFMVSGFIGLSDKIIKWVKRA